MHPTNCLNCGADLHAGFKFCAKCGQKVDIHRLNFHELGHDALHYVTHADKGIFHLLRELAIRPGVVAREFMAGKRKKYFKPVNFYLIVAGILVFMTSYFHYLDDSLAERIENNASAVQDPILQQKMIAMVKRFKNVNHYFSKYSNVVNMLSIPLYAAIFWLFYRRDRYSYVEHLVANMYFMGFTMLVLSLLLVPWQKIILTTGEPWLYTFILVSFEVVYRSIAYYRFINKKGAWPCLKAIGVSLVPVVIWVGGGWLLVDHYIRNGF